MRLGLFFFAIAVALLVTHHWMHEWFGFTCSTAAAALIPAVGAMLAMAVMDRHNNHIALRGTIKHIDFESLLFFAGLFVMVGGLEKTHFMDEIAQVFRLATSSQPIFLLALHWGAGGVSAVVDNVPMALGMTYVLKDIALPLLRLR